MKRSQTAKTSKEAIEFISEEDRAKFCRIVIDLLKDAAFRQKIIAKQAKCKSFFKIELDNEELKALGIDPHFVFKFKKDKCTGEWDLDIHLDKLKNAEINEYFDLIQCK